MKAGAPTDWRGSGYLDGEANLAFANRGWPTRRGYGASFDGAVTLQVSPDTTLSVQVG